MYICHVLINALSSHMIHINLNMIFYTHVEHSSTETIDIKYYMEKQTYTHTHTRTHRYNKHSSLTAYSKPQTSKN